VTEGVRAVATIQVDSGFKYLSGPVFDDA